MYALNIIQQFDKYNQIYSLSYYKIRDLLGNKQLLNSIYGDLLRVDSLDTHYNNLNSAYDTLRSSRDGSQQLPEASSAICSTELNRLVRDSFSIDELRKDGIYFTGDDLAKHAANFIKKDLSLKSRVLDPACGGGNLLIAISKHLPVKKHLKSTLEAWSKVLYGLDLNLRFINIAKKRIVFEAIMRGVVVDIDSVDEAAALLKHINTGNGIEDVSNCKELTHVIMNPPYNNIKNSFSDLWGTNSLVNSAAVFTKLYIENITPDTQFVAILPEVLRSGNRYIGWRNNIQSILRGRAVLKGKFDSKTDVDVFVLTGRKIAKNTKKIQWVDEYISPLKYIVSDYFNVSVGAVVAYRDKLEGESSPFIYPKNVEPWKKCIPRSERRRFKGRLVKPPFVVIRRTSSPSDSNRAVASVISGKEKVAVENHFIICSPKSGSLKDCLDLLENCKSSVTNEYLNNYIRCRHLTVSAVKTIPLDME